MTGCEAARGVCTPHGDAAGHDLEECVTFTYVGKEGSPRRLRLVGPADAAEHPADCLRG